MKRADAIKNEIECVDLALKGHGLPTYSAMRAQRDELLAALNALVGFCDDPRGSEGTESLAMGLARLLPAARAAIDKATS